MLDTDQKSTSASPHFDVTMRAIAHPVRRKILEWLKAPTLHFPPQPCGFEFIRNKLMEVPKQNGRVCFFGILS
jgi:hypothetical protein